MATTSTPRSPTGGQGPSIVSGATGTNRQAPHASASRPHSPPFSAYLQLVAFTATITVSVSISASQGFATGGNFFGVPLTNETDPPIAAAVQATADASYWLSWAAATSSVSLMIALILQLMQTDEMFLDALERTEGGRSHELPRAVVGAGSWVALLLQASALAFIGQALRAINSNSGSMIQWALLAVGTTFVTFYLHTIKFQDTVRDLFQDT
ncbi:hypothetical protein CABS01_15799 [Colletotrichum abscissum]|uniref:Uncharacterized protein n=1 Tax=Colletotrichum abscissum TaxID=1671311 RepID=A0A9P9XQ22_9PEZI|nr:uncharacterized protein CABS01_15799 [Colletotrichum abscissum]KAI3557262.1 hypothetical protein CABS02_02366 [Colletotrichum abscissum]KAK1474575.1 hypothetical protein CABS01_15799 [Colletotrichum abscissum]